MTAYQATAQLNGRQVAMNMNCWGLDWVFSPDGGEKFKVVMVHFTCDAADAAGENGDKFQCFCQIDPAIIPGGPLGWLEPKVVLPHCAPLLAKGGFTDVEVVDDC